MDDATLSNFGNIHSEMMRVRLKALVNAIHANQGLYNSESIGEAVKRLQEGVQEVSQRTMKMRDVRNEIPRTDNRKDTVQ